MPPACRASSNPPPSTHTHLVVLALPLGRGVGLLIGVAEEVDLGAAHERVEDLVRWRVVVGDGRVHNGREGDVEVPVEPRQRTRAALPQHDSSRESGRSSLPSRQAAVPHPSPPSLTLRRARSMVSISGCSAISARVMPRMRASTAAMPRPVAEARPSIAPGALENRSSFFAPPAFDPPPPPPPSLFTLLELRLRETCDSSSSHAPTPTTSQASARSIQGLEARQTAIVGTANHPFESEPTRQ